MDKIIELRRAMGTLPEQDPEKSYKLVKGVEGITVDLIDYNVNPYKSMYVFATSCWGSKINKWADTIPEHRFLVVKAVLEGQALPLALEVPNFTFTIEGLSRAAFDQFARTRRAVFSAAGMRDNNWKGAVLRVPTRLWNNMPLRVIEDYWIDTKDIYSGIIDLGIGSWQAARTFLPLYVCYRFSAHYNYLELKKVAANRMKFCEMEDTVAVAWLMQRAVSNHFPLLGEYLRPGCDYAGKCQYHRSYTLSELFGCLFKECGRNECPDSDGYAEFNETCTNPEDLEEQLGIAVIRPDQWVDFTWDTLLRSDKSLFEAE